MNLIFSYRECRAAMLAADWRELDTPLDQRLFAKGDARAVLLTQIIYSPKSGGDFEAVVSSEGIEFARLIDQPNEHGYCKLKAIATQPGWIAHKPEPAKEAETHAEF